MHHEILQYLPPKELLIMRRICLGGYQLSSNPTLRKKYQNFYPLSSKNEEVKKLLNYDLISVKEKSIKLRIMFEQIDLSVMSLKGLRIAKFGMEILTELITIGHEINGLDLRNNIRIYMDIRGE